MAVANQQAVHRPAQIFFCVQLEVPNLFALSLFELHPLSPQRCYVLARADGNRAVGQRHVLSVHVFNYSLCFVNPQLTHRRQTTAVLAAGSFKFFLVVPLGCFRSFCGLGVPRRFFGYARFPLVFLSFGFKRHYKCGFEFAIFGVSGGVIGRYKFQNASSIPGSFTRRFLDLGFSG